MNLFLTLTLAVLQLAALAYGFTGAYPHLESRAVRGAALVFLGVGAIFIPLPFVLSAILVGNGTRTVWLAACEPKPATAPSVRLRTPGTEIVTAGHGRMVHAGGESADRS